jgi:hypothetical protein
LFAGTTLDSVPGFAAEMRIESAGSALPAFLMQTKIARIPLVHWLAVFVGLPLFHLVMVLLNRLLSSAAGRLRRILRRDPELPNPKILPWPLRVLLLAGTIRWVLAQASLPLMARQVWFTMASVLTIVACVRIYFVLTGWSEDYIRRRLLRHDLAGRVSLLRLARW